MFYGLHWIPYTNRGRYPPFHLAITHGHAFENEISCDPNVTSYLHVYIKMSTRQHVLRTSLEARAFAVIATIT
jgi:hypothetical protein